MSYREYSESSSIFGRRLYTQSERNSDKELVLDNGEVVRVFGTDKTVHVGCVTLSKNAARVLADKLNQLLAMMQ